jgi:hypothetical protein
MRRRSAATLSVAVALAVAAGAATTAQAMIQPSGPAPNRTLTGSVGLGFTNRGAVFCRSSQGVGEVTGSTTGTMKITYQGCEIPFAKTKCGNVGAEEIQTNMLTTELGVINAANKTVGEDFKPTSGPVDTEFKCGSLTVQVKGSVIGTVISPNSMSEEQTVVFAVEFPEHQSFRQAPESFEDMSPDVLTAIVESQPEEPAYLLTAVHITNQPVAVSRAGRTVYVKDRTEVRIDSAGKPEFGRCQRSRARARYTNASCTASAAAGKARRSKGRYEWHAI